MTTVSHSFNPIICAIDTQDVAEATAIAGEVRAHVGAVKLGLEFFTANGAAGVAEITRLGVPLFLDLKFHDIPNTVAKAIAATAGMNMFMMTVHTSGGRGMLKAAIDASDRVAQMTGKERPLVIGVTLLTSLDQDDVAILGFRDNVQGQVLRLADLAQSAGLDGVVCSPFEIAAIRKACGSELTLVVPGIRPEGSSANDQKRIMTPKEALARGADYLVIGRPMTAAEHRANAAKAIADSLA
ncbi:MAG: orotidine-5'-phosphate decarboxylase [Alphaproteobacteria bacterium]|nr:orotidine-5'-phosphate decarboxylase [Alphaproteobacteria bacterium]